MSEMMPIISFFGYRSEARIKEIIADGQTEIVVAIPMEMLIPHANQAQINHGQSLRMLRDRGGLGTGEAVAVLDDRKFQSMSFPEANARLREIMMSFLSSRSSDLKSEDAVER